MPLMSPGRSAFFKTFISESLGFIPAFEKIKPKYSTCSFEKIHLLRIKVKSITFRDYNKLT